MVPEAPPHRVLILGLGGGTLARLLHARWGNVPIIGVDNDADIVETAASVGWLPRSGLEVVMADAFEYVQTCGLSFDFVAIDLFRGQQLVMRVFGKPFLRNVRALLEPRGRIAVNMFMDRHERAREARIAAIFEIYENRRVGGNVIVHARRRRG
jgi:spermidine synthase